MGNYFIENDVIIDPLNNWMIFNKLKTYNPESFLEIGCGSGSMVWRFEKYHNIPVLGIDSANIFHLLRCTNKLKIENYIDQGFSLPDQSFDFIYSYGIVDAIPQNKRKIFSRELERISRRGMHIFSNKNFANYLPKKHETWHVSCFENEIYDYPEWYKKNNMAYPLNDNLGIYENLTNTGLKLNFGSGLNFFYCNWSNIDQLDFHNIAHQRQALFYQVNLQDTNALSQDMKVVCANFANILECLSYKEARNLLQFCYKTLRPGGSVRIAIQNRQSVELAYEKKVIDSLLKSFLNKHIFSPFSKEIIFEWLEEIGFTQIEESQFNCSKLQPFSREIMDNYADFTTFIEARKLVF